MLRPYLTGLVQLLFYACALLWILAFQLYCSVYFYLSWFNPEKLRKLEMRRIEVVPWERLTEDRIDTIYKPWWLWNIRMIMTIEHLVLPGVCLLYALNPL